MNTNITLPIDIDRTYGGRKTDRAKIATRYYSAIFGRRNPEMYLSGLARRLHRTIQSTKGLIAFMHSNNMISAAFEGPKVIFY
jgi:hypothetical protein